MLLGKKLFYLGAHEAIYGVAKVCISIVVIGVSTPGLHLDKSSQVIGTLKVVTGCCKKPLGEEPLGEP